MNPGILGIGIGENTAVVVENDRFRVIGENAVYVVDGRTISYTNVSEATADRTMSLHNAHLHVLAADDVFDLSTRTPTMPES